MFIETMSNNIGQEVIVSFERTNVIQISNITFYYKHQSTPACSTPKCTGRFRIQKLINGQ